MRYFWLFLICSPVLAGDTEFSLFLSQSEQHQFNENASHHIHLHQPKGITLKAIMMTNESNWTIWINDHKITPESCPNHIRILKVTSDCVDLTWNEHELNLKTNQTIENPE